MAAGHGADDSGLERRVLGGTSAVALRATLPTSPSTLSAVRMFRCFLDGNSSLRHRRDLWSLWRVLRLVRKQLFPACVGLSALRCSSAHQSPPSLLDSRYSSLLKGLPAPPHATLHLSRFRVADSSHTEKIALESETHTCYCAYIEGATDRRLDPLICFKSKRPPYICPGLTAVVFVLMAPDTNV